jgi:exonuclease III
MKILCWNINGFKSILKKDLLYNLINNENPEIFCLEETKIGSNYDEELNFLNIKLNKKYYSYFNNSIIKK